MIPIYWVYYEGRVRPVSHLVDIPALAEKWPEAIYFEDGLTVEF